MLCSVRRWVSSSPRVHPDSGWSGAAVIQASMTRSVSSSFQQPPQPTEPLAIATPTEAPSIGPKTDLRRPLPTNVMTPTPYSNLLSGTPSYPPPSGQMTTTPSAMPTRNLKGAKWPDGRKLLHPDKFVTTRVINVDASDTLKVRSGPGTSFNILAEIPANETSITAFNYDQVWDGNTCWCPIERRDVRGYVGRSHLPKP